MNQQLKRTMNGVLIVALLAFAPVIHAHPGHDLFENGAAHVVSSPFHLLVLVTFGFALVVAARFVRQSRARFFLHFGAAASVFLAVILGVLGR